MMKARLAKILRLAPTASAGAIFNEVERLVRQDESCGNNREFERLVAAKISESMGALGRDQAVTCLEAQGVVKDGMVIRRKQA